TQAHFKPEFLNRIDDILMFTPLTIDSVQKIVEKFIHQLSDRLESQEITLGIDEDAQKWIAKEGYNPAYGARPLQRFITNNVETPLAKEIIAGKILPHSKVTVTLRSEERRVGKECKCWGRRRQAEDGIRDRNVTGVQTCALPI